jgi:hypothetical protein
VCHLSFGEKSLEKHRESCIKKEASSHRACKKCGKEYVSFYSDFCSRSCANTRSLSEETKKKISLSNLGKSIASRDPKPCKYCGILIDSIEGKIPKSYCLPQCNAAKLYISRSISSKVKGRTGGYRERGGRGHGSHYKGIWMDSTWELCLAQRLDEIGITWERDLKKHVFLYQDEKGEERKYFPDFYLPLHDLYIEVKGYWTKQTRHKMNEVLSRNSNSKFLILESLEQIRSFVI